MPTLVPDKQTICLEFHNASDSFSQNQRQMYLSKSFTTWLARRKSPSLFGIVRQNCTFTWRKRNTTEVKVALLLPCLRIRCTLLQRQPTCRNQKYRSIHRKDAASVVFSTAYPDSGKAGNCHHVHLHLGQTKGCSGICLCSCRWSAVFRSFAVELTLYFGAVIEHAFVDPGLRLRFPPHTFNRTASRNRRTRLHLTKQRFLTQADAYAVVSRHFCLQESLRTTWERLKW